MGRLRRNLGLFGLLGAACVLAAYAAAAPAPTLFELTIAGTAHQEWTFTPAPVDAGDCRRTETSEGIRTVKFRTEKPITVGLAGGRVVPVTVRGIGGTVVLGGAITTDESCGAVGNGKTADCAQTRRTFRGASLRALSPAPGSIALASSANVRLRSVDCPAEPGDVQRRPLGPLPKLLRLPEAALTERKVARITLSASRSRRTSYGSPEGGVLTESVVWTLTFVRARGPARGGQ